MNIAVAQHDPIMPTYARLDVTFVDGQGVWLRDQNGRRYFDALSGIAVCGLGHAHPAIVAALTAQANALWHTSNLYRVEHQEALAERLVGHSGLRNVFFCNSGAEANEAAIKLARKFGHENGIAEPVIVVMEGAFHGRTLAALSATGNAKAQQGFEPLVAGFLRVPFGNVQAAAQALSRREVVAVLVEPILGEGGVVIPPHAYLSGLRQACDANGALLMVDEVQTGMCRTGQWFACGHDDIEADVMTLAKALGNGFPIGACLAGERTASILGPGTHGSTFGGNPLAARVALTVCDILATEDYAARAAYLGARILNDFSERLADQAGVVDIRGRGLMLALELDRPCAELVATALERGLLLNVTAERVVRLLPPLIMTDDEARELVERVCTLVENFLS